MYPIETNVSDYVNSLPMSLLKTAQGNKSILRFLADSSRYLELFDKVRLDESSETSKFISYRSTE